MSALEYALQFYGFLIQTVPVALLWYVPFPSESLRISGKRSFALLMGTLIAFAMGFTALCGFLKAEGRGLEEFMRYAPNFYMGIALLTEAGLFFKNVKTGPEQKMLPVILLVHYAAILFTICSILTGLMHPGADPADGSQIIYGWRSCLIYSLLSLLTVPPLFFFLKGSVRFACRMMERKTAKRGCIYFTGALLLFCAAIYGLSVTEYRNNFYGLGLSIVLFAFLATDCILYIMFFHEMRMEVKTRELEKELRLLNSRYRQINSSIEEARRARHDIRHHLNLISVLNREGDRKGLEDYLARYEAVFQRQEERYFCGYPALDSILKYYVQKAEESGIHVKTKIASMKEDPGVDVVDLTVLVGNLLENAVMGCLSLDQKEERRLEISVRKADATLLLLVKNSCGKQERESESFENYKAFPSTKHAQGDGYGLRSIHTIAEKYGGSAEFRAWDGTFTARVVLNL